MGVVLWAGSRPCSSWQRSEDKALFKMASLCQTTFSAPQIWLSQAPCAPRPPPPAMVCSPLRVCLVWKQGLVLCGLVVQSEGNRARSKFMSSGLCLLVDTTLTPSHPHPVGVTTLTPSHPHPVGATTLTPSHPHPAGVTTLTPSHPHPVGVTTLTLSQEYRGMD